MNARRIVTGHGLDSSAVFAGGSMKELHAGDTYVQNGTRHAWRNRSSEPCSILVVLLGTRREPSGLSVAQSRR